MAPLCSARGVSCREPGYFQNLLSSSSRRLSKVESRKRVIFPQARRIGTLYLTRNLWTIERHLPASDASREKFGTKWRQKKDFWREMAPLGCFGGRSSLHSLHLHAEILFTMLVSSTKKQIHLTRKSIGANSEKCGAFLEGFSWSDRAYHFLLHYLNESFGGFSLKITVMMSKYPSSPSITSAPVSSSISVGPSANHSPSSGIDQSGSPSPFYDSGASPSPSGNIDIEIAHSIRPMLLSRQSKTLLGPRPPSGFLLHLYRRHPPMFIL